MYDELIERCRACSQGCNHPSECSYFEKLPLRCMRQLLSEAADAIEELKREYESIAKSLNESVELVRKLQSPCWIPVTERLPDNIDEEVLVCNEGYGKDGTGVATVAVYNGNGWLECWERKQYLACITHWMTLPEPPKEET